MMKRIVLAAIAIFVAWCVMDFVMHALILGSTYAASPQLWRPEGEIKIGLLYLVVFINAFAFAYIYGRFVGGKSLATAVKFGLWFGLAAGVAMAYGTYAVMPIPYSQALAWFFGHLVEAVVGGLLAGLIIKD